VQAGLEGIRGEFKRKVLKLVSVWKATRAAIPKPETVHITSFVPQYHQPPPPLAYIPASPRMGHRR